MIKNKQILWLFIGFGFIAYGVSMVVHVSDVGVEPWAALNIALEKKMWTYGAWNALIQSVFIILTVIIEKRLPRVGTYINMIFVSLFIDIFVYLNSFFYVEIINSFLKYGFYISGVIVATFGTAMAIVSGLGTGAKTQFYVAIHQKFGFKLSNCKYAMEILGLLLAVVFGGPIFVGTLLFILVSGFFIGFFVDKLQERF